jgi:hypothetical protein
MGVDYGRVGRNCRSAGVSFKLLIGLFMDSQLECAASFYPHPFAEVLS